MADENTSLTGANQAVQPAQQAQTSSQTANDFVIDFGEGENVHDVSKRGDDLLSENDQTEKKDQDSDLFTEVSEESELELESPFDNEELNDSQPTTEKTSSDDVNIDFDFGLEENNSVKSEGTLEKDSENEGELGGISENESEKDGELGEIPEDESEDSGEIDIQDPQQNGENLSTGQNSLLVQNDKQSVSEGQVELEGDSTDFSLDVQNDDSKSEEKSVELEGNQENEKKNIGNETEDFVENIEKITNEMDDDSLEDGEDADDFELDLSAESEGSSEKDSEKDGEISENGLDNSEDMNNQDSQQTEQVSFLDQNDDQDTLEGQENSQDDDSENLFEEEGNVQGNEEFLSEEPPMSIHTEDEQEQSHDSQQDEQTSNFFLDDGEEKSNQSKGQIEEKSETSDFVFDYEPVGDENSTMGATDVSSVENESTLSVENLFAENEEKNNQKPMNQSTQISDDQTAQEWESESGEKLEEESLSENSDLQIDSGRNESDEVEKTSDDAKEEVDNSLNIFENSSNTIESSVETQKTDVSNEHLNPLNENIAEENSQIQTEIKSVVEPEFSVEMPTIEEKQSALKMQSVSKTSETEKTQLVTEQPSPESQPTMQKTQSITAEMQSTSAAQLSPETQPSIESQSAPESQSVPEVQFTLEPNTIPALQPTVETQPTTELQQVSSEKTDETENQSSEPQMKSVLSLDQILDSELLAGKQFADNSVAVPNNVPSAGILGKNKKLAAMVVGAGMFVLLGFVAILAFPSGNSDRQPNEVVDTAEVETGLEGGEHGSPTILDSMSNLLFPEAGSGSEELSGSETESSTEQQEVSGTTSIVLFPDVSEDDTEYEDPNESVPYIGVIEPEENSDMNEEEEPVSIDEARATISSFKSQAETYYSIGQQNADRTLIKYSSQIKYMCEEYEQKLEIGEGLDYAIFTAFKGEVNSVFAKIDSHNNGGDSVMTVQNSLTEDSSYFEGKDELVDYIYNR